jgi:hypothetical protein
MQPLDLGPGQPRLGVQPPGDSGQPPRVTCVVGSYQLHPEHFQVSHLYRRARRRTGVKIAAVPPVTSFSLWCG